MKIVIPIQYHERPAHGLSSKGLLKRGPAPQRKCENWIGLWTESNESSIIQISGAGWQAGDQIYKYTNT